MNYWVAKSNYRDFDRFDGRVGTSDTWVTSSAPKDLAPKDRVFYWLMAPASRLVALGAITKVKPKSRNNRTEFEVKRLTLIFDKPLLKTELLDNPLVNGSSFLKRGPVGTLYRLTKEQGEALFRAAVQQNPEFRGVWSDIALVDPFPNPALPGTPQPGVSGKGVVFIGHGRDPTWLAVQSFLEKDCGLKTTCFESESRISESIVSILETMLAQARFAVIVLTAEDATADGQLRARQNVIHETGLAQGKLGFKKVVILKQDGVEELTNLLGLQYIPFKDNIEKALDDLGKVLKREGLTKL